MTPPTNIELAFTLQADLSPQLGDLRVLVNSVGPSGELIWLTADEAGQSAATGRIEQEGGASFPRPRGEHRYDATLLVNNGRTTRSVTLADQDVAFPRVQILRDELLIVGSRCRWEPDGSTRDNAHVYNGDGQLARTFLLGDGIQDLQVSTRGDVWVSYFDEGVYGNFGWGGRDGPEPFGAAGLLRADATGVVRWRYEPPEGFGSIDDCYALNVADDATWAYYYSDFPLVRIGLDGGVTAWSTEVSGARAFAVEKSLVFFFGGYRDDPHRCSVWNIADGALANGRRIILLTPKGDRFEGGFVVGRGSVLHAFDGPLGYRLDLKQISL